mgnify:CR=1 FL=1
MIKQLFEKYRNLILYGLIGGSCALLDFIVYSGLCSIIPFLVANVISTHCGIFCSFFLNRKYNFKVEDNTLRRFFSFYTVGLLGLAVSEGLLFLMVNYFGIEKIVSKLITVVAVALLQFVLNKFITFKTKKNG